MKKVVKSLTAVGIYLLALCVILNTKAALLFSPKHIGMFLLGCLILCLPYFEKENSPSDWRAIFKNNAMMAGGLETFMLIFVGMSRKGLMPADVFAEIALGMRPLFYGFICYAVLRDGEGRRGGEGQKERKAAGDKTQGVAAGGVQRTEGDEALREEGETLKEAEAVPKHDFSSLTRQEKCVAELIARGLTNREIGEELCISETTVKKHVSNIFEKLGISSRKELR